MAATQKQHKVNEFEENVKAFNGIVKENALSSVEALFTMIEESRKLANAQFDQLHSIKNEHTEQIQNSVEKFVKDFSVYTYPKTNIDSILDIQKSYAKLAKDASDKVLSSSLSVWRKSTENAFSTLDGFYKTIGF